MMKRIFLFLLFISSFSLSVLAGSWPVQMPSVGNGRLKVCAQNCRNYFVTRLTENGRSDYTSVSGLQSKTQKMVASLRYIDADIYALCELQSEDTTLSYLTAAMNADAGYTLYAYIKTSTQYEEAKPIMSGFIYRKDKVAPYGYMSSTSTQPYYQRTMRVQTWTELSTGERFVLSMNHFKAKDSTSDQGEAKRVRNASDLISSLSSYTKDPDILIMGDLNETTTEQAVSSLVQAGYAEQLARYLSSAYSYYYGGQYQLIDHIMANTSMAGQLTGAASFHINTGTNKNGSYWYSDHDPVFCAMNLGDGTTLLEDLVVPTGTRKFIREGRLYIEHDGHLYDASGAVIK